MTLDDVKLIDFNSDMSQDEIDMFITDLTKCDTEIFTNILFYLLDNFYFVGTRRESETNPIVKKILKSEYVKEKTGEHLKYIIDHSNQRN